MTYNDDDLQRAVKDGVLSQENVDGFRAYMSATRPQTENMPHITSFNDVFVIIACGLFFWGWYKFFIPEQPGASGRFWVTAIAAALAWGLAEYFTRYRRMALPSILLLAIFGGSVFLTVFRIADFWLDAESQFYWMYMIAAPITMAALVGHWRRFYVPITIAALAAGAVSLIVATILRYYDDVPTAIWFLLGAAVLGGALYFDRLDRERKTIQSDIAFWLHALAAPAFVHPIFFFFGDFSATLAAPLLTLAAYLLITAFSLLIDRRVLIVSSLIYATYALVDLANTLSAGSTVAVALVFLGTYMLLLSVFWQTIRQQVMRLCPENLRAMLPVVTPPPQG